ncbi:tetratricopeptide repeat protein [Cutibacterium sp. WCA-380-WT-3A]|uniref:Tetratricopeptide repeat protein n=1 Tax=Cutibacterium porci TaxID=2605781 RepID=A0A7K0J6H2_9ACTN|nr:tetratricopeptide repeat protein [Cutibacterium porci]MSS45547.1 tetratricopeptide repeat protein [Cutibacterium porci]
MDDMSSDSIHRHDAVDLSGLAAAAGSATSSAGPTAHAGHTTARTWVVEGTEENFNSLLQKSVQHPVLVEFTTPKAHGAEQMESVLRRVTDEAAGKWLLVHVDIDAQPRLAQSLGIQAVPMLVAVIGGQLAPLAQGTIDEQQFRQITEQVIQAATSAGMVGRAEPVTVEVDNEESVGPDPRTVEAEKLIEAGKFDEAVAAYDTLLASDPNDPVLIAGRNGAALLGRLDGKDPAALLDAAQRHPDDVDAQLAAADVELMGGRAAEAFNRIIEVVRTHRDDERETARTRLLDLFAMVGQSDPDVAAARRSLAAALF